MMHTPITRPVYSDYRHFTSRPIHFKSQSQQQWFQPYVIQEHVTTASQQHYQKTFASNPNRPHINIKLDNRHTVRALVDSGSSICLGDSSLINHIAATHPDAPPINVTDVHGGRKKTLGCYNAMLSVEDK